MTAGAATATGWSREEDKAFEDALAASLPLKEGEGEGEDERRWEELAAKVPGKTAAEVRRHYDVLMEDLRAIEAGKVPLPSYVGLEKGEEGKREQQQQQHQGVAGVKRLGSLSGFSGFDSGRGHARSGSKAEQERRKGIPWTEEEHKLFLLGLDKFGKGDWRSISRNFVVSRSPTQVASHAQKYFIRLNSMNRDRRRASIHDITSVRNGDVSSPRAPITGQMSPAALGPPVRHPGAAHPHPAMPAMAVYGPAVGQPATGHIVSAVGTPIMRPGHPPYVIPVAYPVPPPPMHHP